MGGTAMKIVVIALAIFAILLALVAIATWLHPVVSMTIIVGATMWTILASCYGMDQEDKKNTFHSS
jgi:hypothetical protein